MHYVGNRGMPWARLRICLGITVIAFLGGCSTAGTRSETTSNIPTTEKSIPPSGAQEHDAQAAAAYTAQQKQGVERFRQAVQKGK